MGLGVPGGGVVSLLALSLYFTQQSRYINRWLVWLGILPVATNIVIWTDRWHSLFRVNPFIDTSGSLPVFTFDAGFWFRNLHSWYGYALMAATLFFLVRALIGSKPFYQRQIWAMINGMALPMLAHTLFLLAQFPLPQVNLTPVTFGFSGIIVGIAIVRYRLFYVLPLAKDVVFESLDAGIIVYDAAYRLVDLNLSARRITGLPSQRIGLPIDTALAAFPDLVKKCGLIPRLQR